MVCTAVDGLVNLDPCIISWSVEETPRTSDYQGYCVSARYSDGGVFRDFFMLKTPPKLIELILHSARVLKKINADRGFSDA